MGITANTSELKEYVNELQRLNSRGIAFAQTETVNAAAFAAQRMARDGLDERMILRNAWTRKSIGVQKGTMRTREASVGSTQEYMRKQELGGSKTSSGGAGVAIGTSVASGEGMTSAPRKKLVRRPNRMASITLTKRVKTANRKQRNAIAISQAKRKGQKMVYLELQKRKGIFRLAGGKRNPRIEMVQDLSRKVVITPRNPWLAPAAMRAAGDMPRVYAIELRKQLARLRR